MRDDFPNEIKDVLARRVRMQCSNPECRKSTSGPRTEPDKSINIGVAAHITAAAPKGPRFDAALISQVRKSAVNGIWLCQNCAKLVDNDEKLYTAETLHRWKAESEGLALLEILTGSKSPLEPNTAMDLVVIIDTRAKIIFHLMLRVEELIERLNSSVNPPERLLKLQATRQRFLDFHNRHKTELLKGNYIAAHDLVGQIHDTMHEYNSIANLSTDVLRLDSYLDKSF